MKQVLIVEDNKIHMDTLGRIVEGIPDVRVDKAYSAQEAYGMLFSHSYNLFLVDIILQPNLKSDVSGMDFVERLRNLRQYEFTPVIFVTSLEDPKLAAFKELHAYDYVEKPFEPSEVLRTVKKALEFPTVSSGKDFAYFRKNGILYSVKVDEVTFVEISRRGLEIHTVEDVLQLPYIPSDQVLTELGQEGFVRCNRSVLVSKSYIQYIDNRNGYLKLRGVDKIFEIGRVLKKGMIEGLEKEE